jgi:RNA polymerase sigma-70 factor, ECF subfamily
MGPTAEASSAALALDARDGDREALAELYRRAWPRALAAVRTCRGWDEAEDAVAEGFARALDRLDQIREPGAVEAWLTRSALRASVDLARRRRRTQPGGSAAELPVTRGPHAESAAERALMRLEGAAMATSVLQLPDELRRLIQLRYGEGLSVQEIAGLLSVPEGTVRRRCFDASKLLRQRFLRLHLRPAEGECAAVTDQLCRAACGPLSALGHRRIEQHLRGCTGCRDRQAELAVAVTQRASRARPVGRSGRFSEASPAGGPTAAQPAAR